MDTEVKTVNIRGRVWVSLFLVISFFAFNMFTTPIATLISGNAAGLQLNNSNTDYLVSQYVMGLTNFVPFLGFGLVILLGLIWLRPVISGFKSIAAMTAIMAFFAVNVAPQNAYAFFQTTDKTEAYTIMPNESAFWIPDVGANKDSQVKFDSLDYYVNSKIAVKRFVIPHHKLGNTGGYMGWDSYVPDGRLIIVDRTPYAREWTFDTTGKRGTGTKDESFPCQSSEGLDVTAEVSVAASVKEDNAPKFLYNFGVQPIQGDRSDPQVVFTSVYLGRSLTQVMDGIGKAKMHVEVCNELSRHSLDYDNTHAAEIMDKIEKDATPWFLEKGITIDLVGWAGTFTFSPDIQVAINRKYDADKIGEVLPILKQKAVIDAMVKWDGKVPSTLSGIFALPVNLWDAITGFFSSGPTQTLAPKSAATSK